MDKETINDSENINSDEWKFLLLMMLTEDIKQKNSQWKYPKHTELCGMERRL